MAPIIDVKGVSKSYFIAHEGREKYTTLSDVITRKAKRVFGSGTSVTVAKEEFWALKDINFEVEPGDRVGIIGRNGAGKSTLLKILSRITEPTTGHIRIRGRVASLLEVGTGFHPELTGRENIFLNGAILGMNRAEIRKHFDAIVDFAEIEKFLDTPVKRYSSGMYVRLAFAVAAHLEPEILIVDEVLAVGDMEFQQKCLGKMDEVSKGHGRTVLFVSHNTIAIKNLCNKGLLLENGKNVFAGEAADVLEFYSSTQNHQSANCYENQMNKTFPHFAKAEVLVSGMQPSLNLSVHFTVQSSSVMNKGLVVVDIFDKLGICIYQVIPSFSAFIPIDGNRYEYRMDIEIPGLKPGSYDVSLWLGPDFKNAYEWLNKSISFQIHDSPELNRTMAYVSSEGYIVPKNSLIRL